MLAGEYPVSRAHLVPTGAFRGIVHSVFATACNIAVDGRLITLHDAAAAHTPTSIRLAASGRRSWSPVARAGDRAVCRAGFLAVGEHLLDLRQLPVWAPGPVVDPAAPEPVRRLVAEVARVREHHAAGPCPALASRVAALVAALAPAALTAPSLPLDRAVARLIGFGPGLTPAGDDVLVGLLCALRRGAGGCGRAAAALSVLGTVVSRHLDRTTDVSTHHLRLAVEGAFSQPLGDLVDAVAGGAPRETVRAHTRAVLDVGATSGADALLGVLAGLDTVHSHARSPEKVT